MMTFFVVSSWMFIKNKSLFFFEIKHVDGNEFKIFHVAHWQLA